MRRYCNLVLVALLTVAPKQAFAEEAADVAELLSESIVSTPSKSLETAAHAAATVSSISAEDLRRYGIRSLDEALNFLTQSVVVTDPTHAKESGARGVLLTGDYNNHFLVLLNGHALNEAWNSTAYVDAGLGVPLELIDHIEVTLGPGSVMYGSEAMLGVINVITRKANAYSGVSTVTELGLSAPIDHSGSIALGESPGRSGRFGLGYGRTFKLSGKPAELVLAFEWRDGLRPAFEVGPQTVIDPVTGRPKDFGARAQPGRWGGWINHARQERVPSAFAQLTVGDFSLWLRTAEYYRQSLIIDSTVMAYGDFDDPRSAERDRWLNLDARQRFALGHGATIVARGFADIYAYRWTDASSALGDCPTLAANGCTQLLTSHSNNYGGEVKASVDWAENGKFVSLVGSEVRLRRVDSRLEYLGGTVDNQYQKHDVVEAVYAEQRFAPLAELEMNLGARLDHYPGFGTAFSPRAAVGVAVWRGGRWKNIYSKAFRAPTFYELNYRDAVQIQNPHLGPEKVWSVESILEQKLGAQRLSLGVFHSRWEHLIQYATLLESERARAVSDGRIAPGSDVAYEYRNIASMKSYGVESRLDGNIASRLAYGVSGTLAHSRVDLGDGSTPLPLTVMPSVYGNARLAYELPNALPTVALATRFEAKRYADRNFDGGFTNGARVAPRLDVKLTLTGRVSSIEGLGYRIGAGYSFARVGPYVVGPNLYAADSSTRPELSPVERLYAFVGLEFAPDR